VDLALYTDLRPAPGTSDLRAHYEEVISDVRLADELGFSAVWTSEQHGADDGYLPAQLPALAAFARVTSRIRLGTGVILLPLAQPRRVAEEACVVDVLSGGRLILGVGAGSYPHEFAAFGVDRRRRGELLESAIRFIRPGLAGGILPDGLPVAVPPLQRPIPLVVGGMAERAIDRAVRLADGWFGYAYDRVEEEIQRIWDQRLGPALERHERNVEGFRISVAVTLWASRDPIREWKRVVGPAFAYQQRRYAEWDAGSARAEGYLDDDRDLDAVRPRVVVGRPDEVADRLIKLGRTVPLDEVVFWHRLPGVARTTARAHLELLAAEVMPAIRRHAAGVASIH
jgi:alkanesulfonate monooxygenase SsuD/methylene tetrahydromethanopterin reductase-like flavin-dependent oxidoreductase (luciferase family)